MWLSSTDEKPKPHKRRFKMRNITQRMREHEAKRLSSMTAEQMELRIEKMTNPLKLATLIEIARNWGMRSVVKEAKMKLEIVTN